MNSPRLYFGIRGTGQIKGSAECVMAWKLSRLEHEPSIVHFTGVAPLEEPLKEWAIRKEKEAPGAFALSNGFASMQLYMEELTALGYNGQKYAIELRGYRDEANLALYVWSRCGIYKECRDVKHVYKCDCFCQYKPIQKHDSTEFVKKLPRSFCYIQDPHTGDLAILITIDQPTFNRIKDGMQNYIFTNVLPRALRGE